MKLSAILSMVMAALVQQIWAVPTNGLTEVDMDAAYEHDLGESGLDDIYSKNYHTIQSEYERAEFDRIMQNPNRMGLFDFMKNYKLDEEQCDKVFQVAFANRNEILLNDIYRNGCKLQTNHCDAVFSWTETETATIRAKQLTEAVAHGCTQLSIQQYRTLFKTAQLANDPQLLLEMVIQGIPFEKKDINTTLEMAVKHFGAKNVLFSVAHVNKLLKSRKLQRSWDY